MVCYGVRLSFLPVRAVCADCPSWQKWLTQTVTGCERLWGPANQRCGVGRVAQRRVEQQKGRYYKERIEHRPMQLGYDLLALLFVAGAEIVNAA